MTDASTPGPWSPLREPMFRAMWLALVVSGIGTWIDSVTTAWLVIELGGSAAMLGLVQAAQTAPVVLFALLAGALADIVDRRVYLVCTQLWMLLVASTLALLAHAGALTPWLLVGLSFALGLGNALAMPAQNATTPELVDRSRLAAAVTLQSLGVNVARALGPAVGGVVLASCGAATAYALNALSYVGLIGVLLYWKRRVAAPSLPPERVPGAMLAGLRYARNAPALRAVLWRAAAFFPFATALPTLLPLITREQVQGGPNAYGLLLAAIGVGAILGALLLPMLRSRLDRDRLVFVATLLHALAIAASAALDRLAAIVPVALLAGVAWIAVLASLQVAAQTAVPAWVRARALALYLAVFALGQASGSLLWGSVAQHWGVDAAMYAAALSAVLAGGYALRWRIATTDALDHTPATHWPHPVATDATAIDDTGGVAVISVEYRVRAERRAQFLLLIARLGATRRRDGAFDWQLLQDVGEPHTFVELFRTGSWLEHLRQHQRVTAEEQALQQQIGETLVDGTAARVRHFVAARAEVST